MEPVILASSSPQRTAILRELNIPFQVVLPDFAESAPEGMPEEKVAEFLAAQKVRSVIKMYPPEQEIRWALGADTVIALEGKFYGKPQDADEAASFLRAFSGKTQTVYTSIALYKGETKSLTTRTSKSAVTFKTLSEDEIDWYLQTAEWHNAAGGYRLQGKGACFISRIFGSASGIVGLPVYELYDMLKRQGYSITE